MVIYSVCHATFYCRKICAVASSLEIAFNDLHFCSKMSVSIILIFPAFVTVGIVKYMLDQSKPPSSEISSTKELTSILKEDNPPVVLLCAQEMVDSYYELANSGRESFLIFKHSSSEALCSDFGLVLGTAGILIPYL